MYINNPPSILEPKPFPTGQDRLRLKLLPWAGGGILVGLGFGYKTPLAPSGLLFFAVAGRRSSFMSDLTDFSGYRYRVKFGIG